MARKLTNKGAIRKIPKTKRGFYRVLHSIADSASPRIKNKFIAAIDELKEGANIKALRIAVENQDTHAIGEALGLNSLDNRLQPLLDEIRTTYAKAAQASKKSLPRRVGMNVRFDMFNPRAVDYIQAKGAELITGITNTTRKGIQKVIQDGFELGLPIQTQVRQIKNLIGLTDRQISAVNNFKNMLLTEKRNPKQVKRMVDKFRRRQLTHRATMIAHTESMTATNAAQQELWEQAIDQDLIDPDVKKVFIITPDDYLCPICKPIPSMNNEGVPVNGFFDTPVGPIKVPPVHIRCRCSFGLE